MRETLFRGKRIDDDKWTYGYLFQCWGRCYLLWGMNGANPVKEEVYPETVGEYTGLKDLNGKKMFEGDIVKLFNEYVAVVIFESARFLVNCEGYNLQFSLEDSPDIEVIGNIHDNRALLEAKE